MQKGTIIFWNEKKNFGFISRRTGNLIEKFFFHGTRVTLSEIDPAEIKAGNFVRFNISPLAPKREGDSRYAIDVQIFKQDPNLLEASAGTSPLAGAETSTSAVSR